MTTIWVIISILLAINSMWLLKLNKDLAQTNDELIARNIMRSLMENEYKIPIKPLTDKQKDLVNRWFNNNKED
ncbi:hypothetical protein [Mammaliicoccus vitulinus]|uniref:hypothetical protein n=1 Tax=Mammaliicoccus vitulinus TaxID=71237 RepID=UPI0028D46A8E|nr:hypothetical protein [Mammaliicoccus vitulinus]